jgi:hypothetical protein
MIDHEVGVNARVLKIPKIDSDYFDEEGTKGALNWLVRLEEWPRHVLIG